MSRESRSSRAFLEVRWRRSSRRPEEHQPEPDRGGQRAERVLQGWWKDPDFLDRNGDPLKLPLRGTRRSFAALVKRYAGDPRVRTLLEELHTRQGGSALAEP